MFKISSTELIGSGYSLPLLKRIKVTYPINLLIRTQQNQQTYHHEDYCTNTKLYKHLPRASYSWIPLNTASFATSGLIVKPSMMCIMLLFHKTCSLLEFLTGSFISINHRVNGREEQPLVSASLHDFIKPEI